MRNPLCAVAVSFALAAAAAAEGGIPLGERAYLEALRESGEAANARMERAQQELADLPPVARFEAFRIEGLAALRDTREELAEIEPRPDDQGLLAAAIAMYAVAEQIFEESLPEAFELLTRERVRNADLARLEALTRHIEDAPGAAHAKLMTAYRAFLASKGWRTVPAREAAAEPPEPAFTAPGIPPPGSRLDGDTHVAFAIRYRNEVLELRSTYVSSANRLMGAMGADGATLEATRKQELEQVRSVLALVQKLEPWQGDATLREGLLACGRDFERTLERPVRAFAKAVGKGFTSQKQVDAANALIREIEGAVNAAIGKADAADRAFAERWAFEAYDAWRKAQPKEAPSAPRRDSGEDDEPTPRAYPEPDGPPA